MVNRLAVVDASNVTVTALHSSSPVALAMCGQSDSVAPAGRTLASTTPVTISHLDMP
ncbi:MAG: hypothetical protein K8S94_13590 [Planctomycetia bacterium]|nr:hypothetical protein [Planctomycetia bacterium]